MKSGESLSLNYQIAQKYQNVEKKKNLPRRLKNKKGEKTHCIRFLPGVLID